MGAPRRRVVYVVAKAPRAGQSKTRLCPPLTHAQAADLAAAFLADTISLVRAAGIDTRLICRDEAERAALRALAPTGVSVHVQEGVGLGAALESAFTAGLGDGYDAVGVFGMDTPTLPARVISESFDALADADVALGPSTDGGYYLLTAGRLFPRLFREMVWSTDQVAAETRRRCAALGLRVHDLPEWDDVDDFASLLKLRASLERADTSVAPRTRAALRALEPLKEGAGPNVGVGAEGGGQ
jgi:uncharacterized protein